MRRLLFALALLLLLPGKGSATWSIIAIDLQTGRVVISSATCAANQPDQLKLLQAIVLPGVAVAAAQASVDGTHTNQRLIFEELRKGTAPSEIIRMLEEQEAQLGRGRDGSSAIEGRQFGIVDMQGRHAGRSGATNGNFSRNYGGISDDGRLVYSVQGNIILTEEALIEAAQVMKTERSGDMLDRVMLAMEKANSLGGDSRCSCEGGGGGPIPGLNCTNRTTSVGYILAADPGDARGMYAENHPQVPGAGNPADLRAPWNDGDYYLYIGVYPGNFRPGEDASPVCTLRLRYNAWVAAGRPRMNLAAPAPNVPRMQLPPEAQGGGGGGGGGRAGGAGPDAPPPTPQETPACANSANALPPGARGGEQASAEAAARPSFLARVLEAVGLSN